MRECPRVSVGTFCIDMVLINGKEGDFSAKYSTDNKQNIRNIFTNIARIPRFD